MSGLFGQIKFSDLPPRSEVQEIAREMYPDFYVEVTEGLDPFFNAVWVAQCYHTEGCVQRGEKPSETHTLRFHGYERT